METKRGYSHTKSRFTRLLLIVYLLVVCWILLFKLGVKFSYMEKRSVSLVPFNELFTRGRIDAVETILNIIIFIPLGMYAGVLFRHLSFGKKLVGCFLLSTAFEAIQYIVKIGAFDSTDIVTNTCGGLTGLLFYKAIEKMFNSSSRAQQCINIIGAAGTVILVALLVLLKLNLLPVRYQ